MIEEYERKYIYGFHFNPREGRVACIIFMIKALLSINCGKPPSPSPN